jgi:lipopolysaccharide exporter
VPQVTRLPNEGTAAPPSMLVGVAWVLGLRVFERVAGLVSIVVLSRLLVPEYFGLVALGSTVVGLVELFAAFGLDTILVQSPRLTRAHYDTAWTIQLGAAGFCALLLIIAAEPAAWFFREPRMAPIVYALSVVTMVQGARNIRLVDFRKEMRFDKEFLYMGVRRLAALSVTIPAAIILRNQWALICGAFASAIVGLAMSYIMRPYRPTLTLALGKEIFAKSNWLLASNFVMFVRTRSSDFILGRVNGPAAVGSYNMATELAAFASTELVAPINRVVLSDFSNQGTREQVTQRLDRLTGQLAIILMPLGIGLSAIADLIVPLLFGPAWIQAAGALKVLAIASLIAGLGSNFGVALLSLGHFSRDTVIHTWGALILLPMLAIGTYTAGTTGAALAVLVANASTVLIALIYMQRLIGYGPARFIASLSRPAMAAALMYAVVVTFTGLNAKWLVDQPLALRLAEAISIGAVTYTTTLAAIWGGRGFPDGPERRTLRLLTSVFRQLATKVLSRHQRRP